MKSYGKVIVIKRNGMDGAHFPLAATCCLFGRDQDCDVRIQLPTVDSKQCAIDIDDQGHVFIKNLSTSSATFINDKVLSNSLTALSHGDIISIVDRKFRFEFSEESRFYPRKSPKAKSPKTPKDIHTPKTGNAEKDPKMLRRSSPVSPLSPRTDNVPQSSKSSQSAKKNIVSEPVDASELITTHNTPKSRSSGSQKKGATPDFLLGLSPTTFYTVSITPRAVKNLSHPQQGKMSPGPGTPPTTTPGVSASPASPKSATTTNRQRSPGSPYSKTPANLRKSITDLRRRSMPVFETDEDSGQIPATYKQEDVAATVQAGMKRKASDFGLLSAKRKRVSFGPNLSPEHFDKSLPPKTPIKKGATPGRINRQERKSLLKMKSQRGKSASPNGLTPSKRVSPLKTPVEASATVEVTASAKLQSPRSRPQEPSLSLRLTPKATSGHQNMIETSTEKSSPNKKSPQRMIANTPKNSLTPPALSDKLANINAPGSVLIPPFSSPKMKSPLSVLAVCSPTPQKVPSPALKRSPAEKMATPRRSNSSPAKLTTPRSGMSATLKRSSYSPQNSAAPQQSVTPTSSMSTTPRRSSSSPQKLATPRSGISTTPRRSSSSPQKLATPRSGISTTPRRSSSSPQKLATPRSGISTTPRRSSSSPQKLATPRSGISTTPRRSSSSHQQSVTRRSRISTTPRRSSSSPKKLTTPRSGISSASRRSSSSQQSDTRRSRMFATPRSRSSLHKLPTPRRSGSSPKKTATPRRSGSSLQMSPSLRQSFSAPHKSVVLGETSLSPQKTPRSKENLALSKNVSPQADVSGQGEETSLRAVTTVSHASKSANSPGSVYLLLSPNLQTQSPDLFSQVSPKTVGRKSVGEKLASPKVRKSGSPSLAEQKLTTPKDMKRMPRTTKQMRAQSVDVSPIAIKRIMKTPKEKRVSAISLTGIRNLVKTPRIKIPNQAVSTPSGLKRFLKTPKQKQTLESPLIGIKETMKTPITPAQSKQGAISLSMNSNNATPLPKNLIKPIDTPRPVFSEKRIHSPKIFFDETQPTLVSKKLISAKLPAFGTPSSPMQLVKQTGKRSVGRPPSAKKMLAKLMSSAAEKIVSPPQDFNKVVALKAIHRHGTTPKIVSLKVGTPKSITNQTAKSAKKTPYKKTWSDIVKSGVQKPAVIKSLPLHARAAVTKRKSPSLIKNVPKIPKTPRTIARSLAPTTGHADSPATIIVGKKVLGRMHTQKPLPRKGRKQSLSKASRKSAGNTSFTGLTEMFTEQAEPVLNESGLYADIPDTPNGPNEMFVSPLSNRKQSLGVRKSTNLVGVRELFMKKGQRVSDFTGVKELFVSSNTTSTASPSGLKRLMKTPKKLSPYISPAGFGRLLSTPKTKGLLVTPTGVDLLFKTPVNKETSPHHVGKSASKQAQESPKFQSNKSGAIGKKRRAEDSICKPSPKKIRLSPTHEVTQITADKPATITTHKKVQIVMISPSPPKSTGRGRPRKLQIIKSVPVEETVTYILDGTTAQSPPKAAMRGAQSKEQRIAAIPSPPKSTGRGRPRKLPMKDSVQVQQIAKDEKTTQSPPKSAGRGKQLKIVKSPRNKIIPLSSFVDTVTSPNKATGRGRRGQVVSIKAASSPPKITGRGRKNKVQIIEATTFEETAAIIVDVKTVTSPPKTTARGRRGKVEIFEAASSPPKITGRGRKNKVQIIEATTFEETAAIIVDVKTVTSPPKTTGRGRRGKVDIFETASSPTKMAGHGRHQAKIKKSPLKKITPLSPIKTAGRGRRGAVLIFEAVPSPPKVTGRGKKDKVQIFEVEETATLNVDKTAPSPPKTTARGKRDKVNVVEATQSPPKKTNQGQQSKLEVLETAPSHLKTTGPGRRAKVQFIISSPLNKITVPSPAKTTGRGRRGMKKDTTPETVSIASPAKSKPSTADESVFDKQKRGGKRKAGIAANPTPEKKMKVDSPTKISQAKPRTAQRGRTAQVSPVKEPSPIKNSSQSIRGQAKITVGTMSRNVVAAVEKASPVKGRRGQLKKTEVTSPVKGILDQLKKTEVTTSPVKGRRGQLKKTEVVASPIKGRQGQLKKTEVVTSPVKGRRGQLSKTAGVTTSPVKGRRGQLEKTAGVTTSPVKGKRGQLEKTAGVTTLPVKGKRGQLGKTAGVTISPVKGKRGQLEKTAGVTISPVKGKRGQLKKTEVVTSPVKGRRGQLKKVTSPAMRKQEKATTAVSPPKQASVISKKMCKEPKTSSSQPVTAATRQRRRQ